MFIEILKELLKTKETSITSFKVKIYLSFDKAMPIYCQSVVIRSIYGYQIIELCSLVIRKFQSLFLFKGG